MAPNCQTALVRVFLIELKVTLKVKIAIFQVFLSKLPWHKMFYKMLNHAAELITYHSQDSLFRFLHVS